MKKFRDIWQCALLAMIAGSLVFVQGCQANPDSDVVVNKNEGVLEQAIQETADAQNEDIVSEYTDSFDTQTDGITVTVDAQVTAVDGALPVVRVEPHEITGDEVKHWAEALFDGITAYEPIGQMSKTELEEEILKYKGYANDTDALYEAYGNEEDVQMMIEYYNTLIAAYEQEYETAPEEVEKKESDWTFHPYDYYDSGSFLSGWFEKSKAADENLNKTNQLKATVSGLNGHNAILDATNRNEDDYMMHMLWFYYTDEEEMDDIPYTEISPEEAETMAGDVLEELGLSSDWALDSAYGYTSSADGAPSESNYILSYTPVYEGVSTILGAYADLHSEDLYAANFDYSSLDVRIINGIIRNVELVSPMDIVNVENDNVKTLEFDEIYGRFKEQAQISGDTLLEKLGEVNETGEAEIVITSIDQGLFRIKEKGSGEFLMVPAWVFKGRTSNKLGEDNIMIINALDGSVINTTLGY